jgi:hypothetical protein
VLGAGRALGAGVARPGAASSGEEAELDEAVLERLALQVAPETVRLRPKTAARPRPRRARPCRLRRVPGARLSARGAARLQAQHDRTPPKLSHRELLSIAGVNSRHPEAGASRSPPGGARPRSMEEVGAAGPGGAAAALGGAALRPGSLGQPTSVSDSPAGLEGGAEDGQVKRNLEYYRLVAAAGGAAGADAGIGVGVGAGAGAGVGGGRGAPGSPTVAAQVAPDVRGGALAAAAAVCGFLGLGARAGAALWV